ncbi:hypothetical protein EC973_003274 [Apophysomyces ossiformis]|uniref:Uncharacterized protein n=1 Tax=Apophysomyces ossiformis TaxID=679940 RepID=A0A8H7BY60_9FUNG|nr:hypothetical protein EC973_003274 [Apophysomyces ossiformis]
MGDSSRRRHSRSRSPTRSTSRRHRSSARSPSPERRRHRSSERDRDDDDRSRRHRHSRDRSRSERKRRRSRSPSYSSSSSSESSDEERRRRRKKEKKHKKSKKKSKKSKKSKSLRIGDEWGKYGIIYESDIFTKEAEFQAWLIEVKHVDVETLSNNKRKDLFVDFMEDYNTATMPHEKFYNLRKWEQRQHALRMGETLPSEEFNFKNDEEQLRMQHKQAARAAASRQPALQMSAEQIEELTKVNRERVQAERMRRLGLTPKEGMGVRYEYEEI